MSVFKSQLVLQKKQSIRPSNSALPLSLSTMNDTLPLLLRLATAGSTIECENMSEPELLRVVSSVFKRLDMDGDNQISW